MEKVLKAKCMKNKIISALPNTKKQITYLIIVGVLDCCAVLMLCLFYKKTTLFIIKHIIMLSLMCPICWIDKKEHRIPNHLILIGLAMRAAILIAEAVISFGELKKILISDLITAAVVVGFTLLFILISRGGIGAGDLKLFLVMALLLGSPGVFYALFLSLFVSFIVAIFLLITKKKGRKDSIPFAPMIFCGTVLSMIVSGV